MKTEQFIEKKATELYNYCVDNFDDFDLVWYLASAIKYLIIKKWLSNE